jgi:hypothetical protein
MKQRMKQRKPTEPRTKRRKKTRSKWKKNHEEEQVSEKLRRMKLMKTQHGRLTGSDTAEKLDTTFELQSKGLQFAGRNKKISAGQ